MRHAARRPSACVSRRKFRIRVKRGDYRQVDVHVNGKRVKVVRGMRNTATVDLRGLPKGRFKVKIAVTLDERQGRHAPPASTAPAPQKTKKGGRS